MEENENPGLPKPRLFKGSIETLCQPPPLEKYAEPPSTPSSPKLNEWILSLKLPTNFLRSFWILILLLGAFGALYKFVWQPRSSDSVKNLTYLRAPCPDFTGRSHYLDILRRELITRWDPTNVRIQGIWGKGGYGKTELATEFANRFRSHFSTVWTFHCDNEVSLRQGYQELAKHLGVYLPSDTPSKTQEKVNFHLENVHTKKPWLLIFDNVEDALPTYPQRGGAILFTSQKKLSNPQYLLEIHSFSKEESLQLFAKITGEQQSSSMEQLAQNLERIPLLINYAAHYIKATPGCNTSDYQTLFCSHLFEKAGPLWKEIDVNRRYFKSLASSWQFPLKALEKENPAALAWLFVCSYLYPENIPETWIDDWLEIKIPNPGKPLDIQRKAILQSLQNYGIIHFQEKSRTFSLHRFFQYMIRESRQMHIQEDLMSAFAVLSKHNNDYNFFQAISWESGKKWYLHSFEFSKWIKKYPEYFSDSLHLNQLALFLSALARWNMFNYHFSTALAYFNESIHLRQTFETQQSFAWAFDHVYLGFCYYQIGHLRKSIKALNQVENLLRKTQDARPLELSSFLYVKGACLLELCECDEAIRCFHEGVQINRKYQGDTHIEGLFTFDAMTFCLLSHLGRCVRDLGKYEESLQYFNEAIPLGAKSCGKGHPSYFVYAVEKALLLAKMGKSKQAQQLIENVSQEYFALHQMMSSDGEAFGEIGMGWNAIGATYLSLNKIQKAKEAFKKARDCSHKYLGEASSHLMRAHLGLGRAYLQERKIKKALHHYIKQLKICANLEINSAQMVPFFEDFQKALSDALQIKRNTPHVLQASHEAAILSERILGKDHILTENFQ